MVWYGMVVPPPLKTLCIGWYGVQYHHTTMASPTNKDHDVEVLDTSCYLIRNALGIKEQTTLFQDIRRKDQPFSDQPKKALYPSPRSVRFGDNNQTKIKYERNALASSPNIYSQLVDQANDAILQATAPSESVVNVSNYKSITLSAIEYKAASHTLAEHIDHDDSFVYLLSIGCAIHFVVKGPNMADKTTILLESGDLMVFDASTTGYILHGITSIENGSCPEALASAFPVLQNHRYGIQLRVRF